MQAPMRGSKPQAPYGLPRPHYKHDVKLSSRSELFFSLKHPVYCDDEFSCCRCDSNGFSLPPFQPLEELGDVGFGVVDMRPSALDENSADVVVALFCNSSVFFFSS